MVNNWNNPRGPGPGSRPNYYDGIGLDFAGQEQRFGWMLDDTELAKNIELIRQNLITGTTPTQVLNQPIVLSNAGDFSLAIPCSELSTLRFVLDVPAGLSNIGLEGFDGTNWFYFCNRPYTFITQGTYTVLIQPILALQARISLLQSNGPITVRLLGK